ncbi:unnamed protein product [Amoebophrya sp. A25]|nr:unnamed protein product [Amoebophrya sp. A25]|eukprot:GSA25T00011783001.1
MSSTQERISQLQALQAARKTQLEEQKRKVEELRRSSAQRQSTRDAEPASRETRQFQSTSGKKSYIEVLSELLPGLNAGDVEVGGAGQRPKLHRPATLKVNRGTPDDAVHIFPVQQGEVYDKEIQTVLSRSSSSSDVDGDESAMAGGGPAVASDTRGPATRQSAVSRGTSPVPGAMLSAAVGSTTAGAADAGGSPAGSPKRSQDLSEEEKQNILRSNDFLSFFDKSSKMVEKLLSASDARSVLLRGASGAAGAGLGNFDRDYREDEGRGKRKGDRDADDLREVGLFDSERWTTGRCVTDLDWSQHYPELLCASYGKRDNASITEEEGVVCVWNLALQGRPEFVFTAGSQVLTAKFDKQNPAVYLGATYSGSIVLWDSRTTSRAPTQRTPLVSERGHSHPVYAMEQTHGAELVSISTDGKLCVWNLQMLVHPQECVELKRGSREVVANSLAFASEDTLWVGGEDGSICQCQIHQTKSGVTDALEGHQALVSSVGLNQCLSDASSTGTDLLLSSGFDWAVNLYAPKRFQAPILRLEHFSDFVTDVSWHPDHPAVFAAVDASGQLEIWNLNESMEHPALCTAGQQASLKPGGVSASPVLVKNAPVKPSASQNSFFCGCWESLRRSGAGATGGGSNDVEQPAGGGQLYAAGNTDGAVRLWQVKRNLLPSSRSQKEDLTKTLEERINALEPVTSIFTTAGIGTQLV